MRLFFVFSLALAASPAHAVTLAELLEAAWQRSTQARLTNARQAVADAHRTAAESLFPGAPTLALANRNDRLTEDRGQTENEIELAAPIWLPGQRAARLRAVEAERAVNDAVSRAARLALAADVRARVWAGIGARDELELARSRLENSQALEADVARRVSAGELARRDLLFVSTESLGAQTAVAEAEAGLARALEQLRQLTGIASLPAKPHEPLHERPVDAPDPRLEVAQRTVERAHAGIRVAQESRRDNPEIGVQYRRDRGASGDRTLDTVRIAIKIPFATEARNRPLAAAAQAELAQADGDLWLARLSLESEGREALLALESARTVVGLAERRVAAAAEAAGLSQKAFELGETSLAELLRVLGILREARLQFARARTAESFAIARVNQSRGVLP